MGRMLLAISLALSMLGCASNSAFLDAKPIGESAVRLSIAGSLRGRLVDTTDHKLVYRPLEDNSVLPAEMMLVLGLSDRSDILVKYVMPGCIGIGFKTSPWRESSDNVFYASLGLTLSVNLLAFAPDSLEISNKYVEARIPLYTSLYVTKGLALSVIPSLILRNYNYDDDQLRYAQLLGGVANIKLGRHSGMYLEASYHLDIVRRQEELQAGICFFLGAKSGS